MIDIAAIRQAADAIAKGAVVEVSEEFLQIVIDEIERLRGEPDYRTRIRLDAGCRLVRLGDT